MRRIAWGLVGILCAGSTALAADGAPQVGPIAVDMSLEAARAAAPAVAWKDVVSEHSRTVVEIGADEAWTLEGQVYGVSLRPFRSGAAKLGIWSAQPVKRARECRKRVLALAAHFDAYFGALRSAEMNWPRQATAGSISVQRTPDGVPYVVGSPGVSTGPSQDTYRVGKNAIVGETEFDGDEEGVRWSFAQAASATFPFSIDAEARYRSEAGVDTCRIVADVAKKAPAGLAPERLDAARLKPIEKTSAATMHYSIDGLDLPKEGVSVPMRCEVERTTGALQHCLRVPWSPEQRLENNAAAERLDEMRFDPKQLDPDSDIPLEATFVVKLSPSDRRAEFAKIPHPAMKPKSMLATPPRPLNYVWAKTATFEELMAFYPEEERRKEIEAVVRAKCTVQADFSLACSELVNSAPDHPAFEAAALKVLALYRVEPALRDGKSAVGSTIALGVRFRLE